MDKRLLLSIYLRLIKALNFTTNLTHFIQISHSFCTDLSAIRIKGSRHRLPGEGRATLRRRSPEAQRGVRPRQIFVLSVAHPSHKSMDRSRSPSIHPPPSPRTHRSSRQKRRHRGYSLPRGEKSPRRRSEVTLLLCVLNTTSHKWHTSPLRFDPNRINDRELWTDIRYIFRRDLHPLWQRVLGFKRVKSIVPIGVSFPMRLISCRRIQITEHVRKPSIHLMVFLYVSILRITLMPNNSPTPSTILKRYTLITIGLTGSSPSMMVTSEKTALSLLKGSMLRSYSSLPFWQPLVSS